MMNQSGDAALQCMVSNMKLKAMANMKLKTSIHTETQKVKFYLIARPPSYKYLIYSACRWNLNMLLFACNYHNTAAHSMTATLLWLEQRYLKNLTNYSTISERIF